MAAVNLVTRSKVTPGRMLSLRQHGWIELSSVVPFVVLPVVTGAVDDERTRTVWLGQFAVMLATYGLTEWGDDSYERAHGPCSDEVAAQPTADAAESDAPVAAAV